MAMLFLHKKSAWKAMLIFSQKIYMDGHADFLLKKSTLLAMLIFS